MVLWQYVHRNGKIPFGVVQSKDCHITDIVEKPIHRFQVNAGLYVLSNKLLDLLQPDKYCDMPDLFGTAIDEGLDLQLYPLHEPWLDIGRINDYQEANNIS